MGTATDEQFRAVLPKVLGQALRATRIACGRTVAETAKAAGVSAEWYRRLEKGDGMPSASAAEGLIRALPALDPMTKEELRTFARAPRQRRSAST